MTLNLYLQPCQTKRKYFFWFKFDQGFKLFFLKILELNLILSLYRSQKSPQFEGFFVSFLLFFFVNISIVAIVLNPTWSELESGVIPIRAEIR